MSTSPIITFPYPYSLPLITLSNITPKCSRHSLPLVSQSTLLLNILPLPINPILSYFFAYTNYFSTSHILTLPLHPSPLYSFGILVSSFLSPNFTIHPFPYNSSTPCPFDSNIPPLHPSLVTCPTSIPLIPFPSPHFTIHLFLLSSLPNQSILLSYHPSSPANNFPTSPILTFPFPHFPSPRIPLIFPHTDGHKQQHRRAWGGVLQG